MEQDVIITEVCQRVIFRLATGEEIHAHIVEGHDGQGWRLKLAANTKGANPLIILPSSNNAVEASTGHALTVEREKWKQDKEAAKARASKESKQS